MSAQVAYSAELDDSILTRGLPIFVIAPLVFTTFMLGMAVHKGVSGMKTAYLVIRWGARRERRRERFSKLGALRVALAFLLHGARFVMTTYFIQVTVMVVGTADGPFNLLLNSLAMFFILECDDVIDFDLPSGGYSARCASTRGRPTSPGRRRSRASSSPSRTPS